MPDFGLMFNCDGNAAFRGDTPSESVTLIKEWISELANKTATKTFMFCTGVSDVVYYPSRVANSFNWKDDESNRYNKHIEAADKGIDMVRVAGEAAKSNGLLFFPSHRMNDNHFLRNPYTSVLTGEFWLKHRDSITIGTSPVHISNFSGLPDYSKTIVREYRLAIVKEMIVRYSDISDGIELDFSRIPFLFPPGTGPQYAGLLTEFVSEIRHFTDSIATSKGKILSITCRIPPSMETCRWAGIEIEKWMNHHLVDVIIPSQMMTVAFDMPIDEFKGIAEGSGCRVYAGLYTRTQYTWPLLISPTEKIYSEEANRRISPAQAGAAVVNYKHKGADGIQMFNLFFPVRQYEIDYFDAVEKAWAGTGNNDFIYQVTPPNWFCREGTILYPKQIPVNIRFGQPVNLKLYIGKIFDSEYVGLRLGFTSHSLEGTRLIININGKDFYNGPFDKFALNIQGNNPVNQYITPPTGCYVQIPIVDRSILNEGINTIQISMHNYDGFNYSTILTEIQLGFLNEAYL